MNSPNLRIDLWESTPISSWNEIKVSKTVIFQEVDVSIIRNLSLNYLNVKD